MVRHPITGLNLLMTGTDRLDGGTDTSGVSQRSETGRGKLGAKGGRGKYDMWYDCVVKALLSSCMSVGRSFAERLVTCGGEGTVTIFFLPLSYFRFEKAVVRVWGLWPGMVWDRP